ncbi:type II CAAX prenyl endopeptidase Rce1 family protein [Leptolyngbya sp. FACHB-261]|uniref:CPBP family glutamic-type intramembrane protease n=1 Tax=Leptolyngbya sp. FACHB-261 TaxID=2692806 RepID=UPI001681D6EB|nr:CPBP family glutamic-type intramembrane protease [Leptolyngbya sp. FACHB-261]MBD2099925.1 CPBP family intramembrane metalloprotease [Leptolyngbya sp. FACHB-261]
MTLKRLLLSLLTAVVLLLVGRSLWTSVQQVQPQSRLDLYQTDLILQAASWQPDSKETDFQLVVARLLGEDPVANALEQYQELKTTLANTSTDDPTSAPPERPAALDLQIGLLQVSAGRVTDALKTWAELVKLQPDSAQAITAQVLTGLWGEPAQLLPDGEVLIQQTLSGWYANQALARLYELQQRRDALTQLQTKQQVAATQSLLRLAIVGGLPALGSLLGLGLIVGLLVQRLVAPKRSILLPSDAQMAWSVPWQGETVWEVMVLWFAAFLGLGQLVVPLVLLAWQQMGLLANPLDFRGQAIYVLLSYGAMVLAGVTILVTVLRRFAPLPQDWFRFHFNGSGFLWGIGGYLSALPLVIIVSLLNAKLLQGRGGGNPLLTVILDSQDTVAKAILLSVVAIAAPVFEELLFRGFLLPSLTRYLPVGWALLFSSILFAIAHLNLSDVLPLTVLGCVLGFIYLRSRNLMAPMLLHSCWNSGSFLALLILGGNT